MAHSRFAQAALLLESGGRFRLAGSAGFDEATASALGRSCRQNFSGRVFWRPALRPQPWSKARRCDLDLTPWLKPGDDLKRLRFTSALAVPMMGRAATEGALLLAGNAPHAGELAMPRIRNPLRADDLLPIEMLAARLQATRSQTMLFEKLIDSEKFAGLGQLAANVTHQLNNPLTVVLGYASLLEDSLAPRCAGAQGRGVDSDRGAAHALHAGEPVAHVADAGRPTYGGLGSRAAGGHGAASPARIFWSAPSSSG